MHMRTPSGSSRGLIHKELTRRLGNYQAFAMVVQIIQEKMQRVHFRLSQSISANSKVVGSLTSADSIKATQSV
ncbi:hypothetical protein T4A_11634 [Trichinella pseudospiralis]|uniref:Uncharacterized protein n=1 Tax=Trichinella pseudospiralis TaxID=6337 RepID=A0A0V1E8M0_TRIPS|nr:hypothetical protein T4A_11634 [Trichinella pseudospiralis]